MFDIERFIDDCKVAVQDTDSMKAVQDLVARAVSDPNALINALGEPTKGGVHKLYQSDELTVLNLSWAPRMTLMPHNQNMAAAIGVYTGREDNIFWRRIKGDESGRIEAAGADSLGPGKAVVLGKDIIHSVTNPTSLLTSALHVYKGDFFEEDRSEWNPEDLTEQTYDVEKNLRLFEEANARIG